MVVAVALLAAIAAPPVRATGKALAVLAEVVQAPVRPLSLAPDPAVTEIELPSGSADLYLGSDDDMPGVLLVHGVAPGGPRDPRMQQVATALNKVGRTVLAPSLAMGSHRLDPQDTVRIREGIDRLAELTGGKVSVVAFSFGAAYTLVALQQQPRIQSEVLQLATVGAYYDLVHLLQGVTTGRVASPGGGFEEWSPASDADEIVIEFLAEFAGPQQQQLLGAYRGRDPQDLSPPARAIYDLMVNDDPRRTRRLVSELPGTLPVAIRLLSPATGMDEISVPVRAMHSREDPAAPPSESALMIEALEPPATGSLTLIGSFRHVTPGRGADLLDDVVPLISFVRGVLQVQERWGYHL